MKGNRHDVPERGKDGRGSFLNGRVTLLSGDCLDSVVCDPPYHLSSIVKRFGADDAAPAKVGKTGAYARASSGFMGQRWDGGDIAFRVEVWAKVLRVLKPGGYIVAFSSSRTYHRMACAIEDAGFITHPLVGWVTGQGFPKAHSVSKHIDRMAGAKREVVGLKQYGDKGQTYGERIAAGRVAGVMGQISSRGPDYETAPATPEAKQWDGWFYGTQSLKPALEPIYVGQKPFEKGLNGTENILRWGTGAINIKACRVPGQFESGWSRSGSKASDNIAMSGANYARDPNPDNPSGRWPANIITDGSAEVVEAFPSPHGAGMARDGSDNPRQTIRENIANINTNSNTGEMYRFGDSGSAARFFYSSKADADDRLGSKHPTVKPLDLMQYLVRLVTPRGGTCLDPFAGTGTTGEAAWREGCSAILIEAEAEYQNDIRRRMALALAGPDEKQIAIIKAKGLTESPGPLFDKPEAAA
jgi:DNA modification methylase